MSKSVLVVAGEVSGDMHLAHLVREAKQRDPDLQFWGVGGDACEAEGVELLYHTRDTAVMGFTEVLKRYGFFKQMLQELVEAARVRRPDAVLLVDYPGFNLRLARQLKRRGFKIIYYICPQVWAWHRSRIPKMARIIDRLLVIFSFEKEVFAGTGLDVRMVGHPLVDEAHATLSETEVPLPWPGKIPLALLPGSREHEIERLLPDMLKAAERLRHTRPDVGVLVAATDEAAAARIEEMIDSRISDGREHFGVMTGQARRVLRSARAAIVASGTATIEAALMDCPMVVVYRTAGLTYQLGKRLVRVPHIGMVNLIAGRAVCPEFIQDGVRPEALAEAVDALLEEGPQRTAMLEGLEEVRNKLGEGQAAARAADAVLEIL